MCLRSSPEAGCTETRLSQPPCQTLSNFGAAAGPLSNSVKVMSNSVKFCQILSEISWALCQILSNPSICQIRPPSTRRPTKHRTITSGVHTKHSRARFSRYALAWDQSDTSPRTISGNRATTLHRLAAGPLSNSVKFRGRGRPSVKFCQISGPQPAPCQILSNFGPRSGPLSNLSNSVKFCQISGRARAPTIPLCLVWLS